MIAPISIPEPSAADCGLDSSWTSVSSLCAESGWPFAERAEDCLVKLEVNREGPPFNARVERAADGGIKTWVDLTTAAQEFEDAGEPDDAPQSQAWRAAVAAIFVEVSGRIRFVRGVFKDAADARIPVFEVSLPADCNGGDLAEAFGALSVACQFAGPEIQLLMSEPAIVESYLAQSSRAFGCSMGRPGHPVTRVPGESSFEALERSII